jgi:sulfate/thiosulfate transport system permease protein
MSAASPAIGGIPVRAGARPWGRWGLRATAALYLGVMVVLPLSSIFATGFGMGLSSFWAEVTHPVALSALRLTVASALIMTLVNAVMGTATAFVLVRYRFPGRRLLNALVDVPFAVPTLVTGVMLVILYGPQRAMGAWLAAHGFQVIFAPPGIVLALLFVCYPFVIRTVQPVLMEVERGQEEAAYTMGASKWKSFTSVVLPAILPAVVTGSLLAFARALGEFGSIAIVAGNIPHKTLVAAYYVYGQVEAQNPRGASAVSVVLLALSFTLMFLVDWLQERWEARRA